MPILKLGTRGSRLALVQAEFVARELTTAHPELEVEIRIIKTTGDRITDTALSAIGERGLFTREIQNALLDGRVDLAVHSMKDLPTMKVAGLVLGAIPPRLPPHDALITPGQTSLADLPPGAVLGTSSLRRQAQLRHARPDLAFVDLRGNLPTRIRKMKEQHLDGIVLARAGLIRLGMDRDAAIDLPFEICLPAVGQGALAVEARSGDQSVLEILSTLDHAASRLEIQAERSFMSTLEGGCQVPLAAYARINRAQNCPDRQAHISLHLQGLIASPDGSLLVRGEHSGSAADPEQLGRGLANNLLQQGGDRILADIRKK